MKHWYSRWDVTVRQRQLHFFFWPLGTWLICSWINSNKCTFLLWFGFCLSEGLLGEINYLSHFPVKFYSKFQFVVIYWTEILSQSKLKVCSIIKHWNVLHGLITAVQLGRQKAMEKCICCQISLQFERCWHWRSHKRMEEICWVRLWNEHFQ